MGKGIHDSRGQWPVGHKGKGNSGVLRSLRPWHQ